MAETPNIEWLVYAGSALLNVGVAAWTWLDRRGTANAKEVEELRLTVAKLEERVRHLPDAEAVTSIVGDLRELRADMHAMRNSIVPLATSVDRINDFLLRNKDD